jgi:hypothetical protein
MANPKDEIVIPELLSLRLCCRRAGIAPETATKLERSGSFPPIRRIGHRRYVPARLFSDWLKEVTSTPTTAA